MYNWNDLSTRDRQSEMVTCMESLRPAIYQIVLNAGEDIHDFDYYVDCYVDQEIVLMEDGVEFAAANTNNFIHPADLMSWVIDALGLYYYDKKEEEDGN